MLYEWYSGSDTTEDVPRRISSILDQEDGEPSVASVPALLDILEIERDPNWRAYIRTMVAIRFNRAQEVEKSIRWFLEAREEFDPIARNFMDVVQSYCRCLYYLATDYYVDCDDPGEMLALTLTILAYWEETDFDQFERLLVLQSIKTALDQLGHQGGNTFFYRAALGIIQAAHHLEPDDVGILESLLYSYYNVDDIPHAKEVLRWYLERARRDEFYERVLEFATQNKLIDS